MSVIGRRQVCNDSRAPNDLPAVIAVTRSPMLLDVNHGARWKGQIASMDLEWWGKEEKTIEGCEVRGESR